MNRRDFLKAICSLPVLAVLPLPESPKEKITLPPLADFMPMPEYKPTGKELFEQLEETLNGMPFNDELQWCIPMWDASTKVEFDGLKDFITTGKREDGNTAGGFIVDGFVWVEKNGYFKVVNE